MFLLTKQRAKALTAPVETPQPVPNEPVAKPPGLLRPSPQPEPTPPEPTRAGQVTLQLSGPLPLESWNRFGQKLVPKLRSGKDASATVELTVTVDAALAVSFEVELRQALEDLGLGGWFGIGRTLGE